MPLDIAVLRHDEAWPETLEPLAERAVAAALAHLKPKVKGAAELSIVLTDDAEQRELNRQWRGKDSSTNVLSFPQLAPHAPLMGLVGDIILARETVEREAADLGKPLDEHFTHLVVHGFLHLLGYDHLETGEAEAMEALETEILAGLGVANPYTEEPL